MMFRNVLRTVSLVAGFGSGLAALAQEPLPDAPQATPEASVVPNGPTAVMDTSKGRITCQFFQKQAPQTVANFIALAQGTRDWTDPATKRVVHHKPLYNGTIFHRVIPGFMIQGGDPTGTGTDDPGYRFADEFDPNLGFDVPGRLAMANSGPHTNGSQFFITEVPTPHLNHHHTIFGQCDEASMAVVRTIASVHTDSQDKPIVPVVLRKVTIVAEGQSLPAPDAPQSPGTVRRINISAGAAVGMLETHPAPPYPVEAKQAGVSGTVVLETLIGTDGKVEELKVVSGPEPLQQAALDTVKTWRYRPYLLNGQPVEVRTTVNVVFTLGGRP